MRGEIEQDQHPRVLHELSSMIIHILRTPPLPFSFPSLVGPAVSSLSSRTSQASPAAFASLFLGISVALMLFGSVTFVIGLFLMPLVIGLVILFYFVGMIHNLSELGRTILWPGYTSSKDMPGLTELKPSIIVLWPFSKRDSEFNAVAKENKWQKDRFDIVISDNYIQANGRKGGVTSND